MSRLANWQVIIQETRRHLERTQRDLEKTQKILEETQGNCHSTCDWLYREDELSNWKLVEPRHSITLETLLDTKVLTAQYQIEGQKFEVDFQKMTLTGPKGHIVWLERRQRLKLQ
jgi:hypothetical protein